MTGLLPGGSLTGLRTLSMPIFPDLTPGFAYQALELFFMEGYSIPQQVYEQAMETFDWAVYFDVWDDRTRPRIVF